jgi:hypothetical protein
MVDIQVVENGFHVRSSKFRHRCQKLELAIPLCPVGAVFVMPTSISVQLTSGSLKFGMIVGFQYLP